MSASNTIERVLQTDLLLGDLMIIPERGATDTEILEEQTQVGRAFSAVHRQLLSRWNGIGLEVVRFFGCGSNVGEVGRLADFQIDFEFGVEGAIVIGSDASGFAYLEGGDGRIYSFDTDGGTVKELAVDLNDFVDRVLFGPDAADFAGEAWLEEVRENGLVE